MGVTKNHLKNLWFMFYLDHNNRSFIQIVMFLGRRGQLDISNNEEVDIHERDCTYGLCPVSNIPTHKECEERIYLRVVFTD